MDVTASLLALLIVIIGMTLMIAGPGGVRKLFTIAFAPLGGCLKAVFALAIGVILLAALGSFVLRTLRHTPQQPPPPTQAPSPLVFDYPVGDPDNEGRRKGDGWVVTQDFRDTKNPPSQTLSGQHLGEDWVRMSGPTPGAPVHAIADGQVVRAEQNRSFGHTVMVRHRDAHVDVLAVYGHLGGHGLVTRTAVRRGDVLGHIGARGDNGVSATGDSFPPHLHFELRVPVAGEIDTTPGFGYAKGRAGFVNPTSATSRGNTAGGGWIDRHRARTSDRVSRRPIHSDPWAPLVCPRLVMTSVKP